MAKNPKNDIQGIEIGINEVNNPDYFCLTNISKGKDGDDQIRNWMRNRNTVEYLAIWEGLNSPNSKKIRPE